jgi:hypothetical protein
MPDAPPPLTVEHLADQARAFLRGRQWQVPATLTPAQERRIVRLSARPAFIAKRDGMEQYVYPVGQVSSMTMSLHKQVVLDLELHQDFAHCTIVCEDGGLTADLERQLRLMGVGVIVVRRENQPYELLPPKLRCFHCPGSLDRLRQPLRPRVMQCLRAIESGDVCVGVLDLAQVLEGEFDRHLPTHRGQTLGAKIAEASRQNLLKPLAIAAARRVNIPRIRRAHNRTHIERRRQIVERAQRVVDDCLAVLFALE